MVFWHVTQCSIVGTSILEVCTHHINHEDGDMLLLSLQAK